MSILGIDNLTRDDVTGLVDEKAKNYFLEKKELIAPELPLSVFSGNSHTVMEAADVVLLASGTVALEAMLLEKPMVVAYKLSWLTYALARLMLTIPYISLPNLLAGRRIVPECVQAECEPGRLTAELLKWFDNQSAVADVECRFRQLHAGLRMDANKQAAAAVLELVK